MPTKSLILANSRFSEIISLERIVFFAANGSYCDVVLDDHRKILVSKNLHWFEKKTACDLFCRVHKSYIVNLQHISRIFHVEYKIILHDGTSIPLSRSKKQLFWEKLEKITSFAG